MQLVVHGTRGAGAVCAMPGVVHGTAVARAVLERTPHVLVSGDHAVALAERVGVEIEADLLTDASRERYTGSGAEPTLEWVAEHFGRDDADHDTVGAVAVADDGRLAAATSTGGRWFAYPGRVGDTPQDGAEFYAGPAAGASATGHGEAIARVTLSREAVRLVEDGLDPTRAAEQAVTMLDAETGGDAGVIVADRDGRVGSSFNTDLMQTAGD